MYARDMTASPLTRTRQMQRMKSVALFAFLLIAVVFIRIQAGVFTYRIPYASIALNILAVFLYLEGAMTIYRLFVFKEKEKVKEYETALKSSTLERYSRLDLKADVQSKYAYIRQIYMPEVNGLNTVFIQFTHYSKLEDNSPNEYIFRYLFNYCMKNSLILSRYDMNISENIKSLAYRSETIKNSTLTGEQLRRASLRLDFQREICSHSRVTTEVIQISATNMNNNLKFLDYVKTILSELNKISTNYSFDVLSKDEITEFLKEFYKLRLIGLPELSNNMINTHRASGVRLQKDVYANGEVKEYFKPNIPIKKFKKVGGE